MMPQDNGREDDNDRQNAVAQAGRRDIVFEQEKRPLPDFADLPEEEQQALVQRFGELGDAADELTRGIEEDPDEALFNDFAGEVIGNENALVPAGQDVPDRQPVYRGPDVGAIRMNMSAAPAGAAAPAVAGQAHGQAVVRQGAGRQVGQAAVVNPTWRPIYDLPGYMGRGARQADRDRMGEAIRALGRTIFRSMPCFRRMEEECRAARRDPLGEVQVMANIAGMGPNNGLEMDAMVTWIRANGDVIDNGQIEFPNVMPGYRPNIILAAAENDSFLMVEERRDRGSPVDATYIYSWRGGRQVYLENPNSRNALQRIGVNQNGNIIQQINVVQQEAVQRDVARVAPAAQAAPQVRPAPQPQPAQQRVVPPAPPQAARAPAPLYRAIGWAGIAPHVARAPAPEQRPARRRGAEDETKGAVVIDETAIANLPQTRAPEPPKPATKNPMQMLRLAGFATVGTPEGPALRKELADGGFVLVRGAEGKSLTLSKSYLAKRFDASGNAVLAEETLESADSVIEWSAQSPKGPGGP